MIWKIRGKIRCQIQMNRLKWLDLNQKFGMYRMGLGLSVHYIVAWVIYLWPESVLVEEELGDREASVVLRWTKVVKRVVFLVLVEDEV